MNDLERTLVTMFVEAVRNAIGEGHHVDATKVLRAVEADLADAAVDASLGLKPELKPE